MRKADSNSKIQPILVIIAEALMETASLWSQRIKCELCTLSGVSPSLAAQCTGTGAPNSICLRTLTVMTIGKINSSPNQFISFLAACICYAFYWTCAIIRSPVIPLFYVTNAVFHCNLKHLDGGGMQLLFILTTQHSTINVTVMNYTTQSTCQQIEKINQVNQVLVCTKLA